MKSQFLPVLLCGLATLAGSGCTQQGLFKKSPESELGVLATKWPSKTENAKSIATPDSSPEVTPKSGLSAAQFSERRGQSEQAEKMYLELCQRNPKDPAPRHGLAVLYSRQGKFTEAEDYFKKAIALAPNDSKLLNDAGYFYYLASRLEDAERCLRKAVELDRNNRAYCNNLGLALGEMGRYDEAFALFRRAGSENQAFCNQAFVLAQRGEYDKAIELYNRVLTRDPKSRIAADAMVQLAELSNRRKGEGKKPAGQLNADTERALAAANGRPSPYTPAATPSAPRGQSPAYATSLQPATPTQPSPYTPSVPQQATRSQPTPLAPAPSQQATRTQPTPFAPTIQQFTPAQVTTQSPTPVQQFNRLQPVATASGSAQEQLTRMPKEVAPPQPEQLAKLPQGALSSASTLAAPSPSIASPAARLAQASRAAVVPATSPAPAKVSNAKAWSDSAQSGGDVEAAGHADVSD